LTIQKQFWLKNAQVFRHLVVYHYSNKNETEQLIIEDKFDRVHFESSNEKKNAVNKFYLTLLSEAISRSDTKEVSRILNIYSNSGLKMLLFHLANFYRFLSNSNGEFDVKNYLEIFQNFVDQASYGFWYLGNQEKNYESISPVIRNLIYDVSKQNPSELREVMKWAAARTRMIRGEKEASLREKFKAVLPELDDYVLERNRSNVTDASSLASGVEKPKKEKS